MSSVEKCARSIPAHHVVRRTTVVPAESSTAQTLLQLANLSHCLTAFDLRPLVHVSWISVTVFLRGGYPFLL